MFKRIEDIVRTLRSFVKTLGVNWSIDKKILFADLFGMRFVA